jgi:hypothetical protein
MAMAPQEHARRKRGKTSSEVECTKIITANSLGMSLKVPSTKFRVSKVQKSIEV